MDRIVVTGVGGFVGCNLARCWLEKGATVVGLDIAETTRMHMLRNWPKFEFKVVDITSSSLLKEALPAPADLVYHLAGQPFVWFANAHPHEDALANVTGTINVLDVIRGWGQGKIVFASTGEVYGLSLRASEDSPATPTNFYGLSKLTAEGYIKLYSRQFGLKYSILRLALIYGPYFGRNVVYDAIVGLSKGHCRLFSSLNSEYDMVFIDDAIAAFLLAASPAWDGATVNISTGTGTQTRDIIQLVAQSLGVQPPSDVTQHDSIVSKVFGNERALTLGWTPQHSFTHGIQKTVRWWVQDYVH